MNKAILAAAAIFAAVSPSFSQTATEIVATGLQSPNRVRLTPLGNLIVSENGTASNAGRISIVTTSGTRRSLIEGLPAGTDNQGAISGPSDIAVAGRLLYVLIGAGDAEIVGTAPGTALANPKGISSPILSSLLAFRLSADLDDIQTPFRLAADQHLPIADGQLVTLRNEQGQTAEVELITDIRDVSPDPVTIYRGANPYSLLIRNEEAFIADASLNTVFRVDLRNGRTKVAKRYGKVANTIPVGPPVVDPVPNKLTAFGDGFLVISMTGFPFAAGNGRVEYMDPTTGATQPFLFGLTMPIDIAVQNVPGVPRPRFYTLEFSTANLATPPGPGRLMVYDTPEGRAVKSDLVTPTSMAVTPTGEIYITELGPGRLLRVRLTQ